MPIKSPSARPHVADEIAARALAFLASDPERLGRFLALSGLDPATIRTAAGDPGFLPAVLDHILSDERMLLDFADSEGCRPRRSGARARRSAARDPSTSGRAGR